MSVRRERALLSGVVFVVLFGQVLLYPGVPELIAAFQGAEGPVEPGGVDDRLDAGTLFLAAEFAGFVLFAGAWGAASDALGRRRALVVAGALGGSAGYAALAALPASAPFGAALALRFLQGALTVGAFSLAMTMLMDMPGGHGRNMGAAGIAIGLGTALGAPVGGRLYAVGTRAPLAAAAVLLVGAAALGRLATDRVAAGAAADDREGVRAALATLRRRPALSVPYAFGFVDRLTAGFFALVGSFYFQTRFGVDAATTGLLLGAFFGPFALLQYPFGALSDRVGRAAPVAAGSLAYGAAVVGVSLAPTVPLAGAAMVVVGVCGAVMAPATMALVTDLAAADERGLAMGGFNVVGSLGFLAGVVGGGLVAGRLGFGAAFLAAGSLEVAVALLAVPALLGLAAERTATFGGG